MANLRNEARGRECMVRVPYHCNSDPNTVVLAHLRLAGISGMGIKAPDIFGAWCCSACHAYCDTTHTAQAKLYFYEGVFRTQALLIHEEKVKW